MPGCDAWLQSCMNQHAVGRPLKCTLPPLLSPRMLVAALCVLCLCTRLRLLLKFCIIITTSICTAKVLLWRPAGSCRAQAPSGAFRLKRPSTRRYGRPQTARQSAEAHARLPRSLRSLPGALAAPTAARAVVRCRLRAAETPAARWTAAAASRRLRCRLLLCDAPRCPPCLPQLQLVLSGARDELKQLARARLEESGWTDEVRQLCRGAPRGRPSRAALGHSRSHKPKRCAAWPGEQFLTGLHVAMYAQTLAAQLLQSLWRAKAPTACGTSRLWRPSSRRRGKRCLTTLRLSCSSGEWGAGCRVMLAVWTG